MTYSSRIDNSCGSSALGSLVAVGNAEKHERASKGCIEGLVTDEEALAIDLNDTPLRHICKRGSAKQLGLESCLLANILL